MSRNYYHSRWNDQNWKDDGHCLRRSAVQFGDVRIGASITYWVHEKRATGSIDYSIDKRFGAYTLYGDVSQGLREFHGPGCVTALKEYIDRFIIEHYPTVCRWAYDNVYYIHQNPRYKIEIDPADNDLAWAFLESLHQDAIAVERGTAPGPVKRSGQMALCGGA